MRNKVSRQRTRPMNHLSTTVALPRTSAFLYSESFCYVFFRSFMYNFMWKNYPAEKVVTCGHTLAICWTGLGEVGCVCGNAGTYELVHGPWVGKESFFPLLQQYILLPLASQLNIFCQQHLAVVFSSRKHDTFQLNTRRLDNGRSACSLARIGWAN